MATGGECEPGSADFTDEVSYELRKFIDVYTLPQTVKVVSGISCYQGNPELDWEFSTGDVITLKGLKCEEVTLSFERVGLDGQDRIQEITVPRNHPATFEVLPFYEDNTYVYKTVADLTETCPYIVKAGVNYKGYIRMGKKVGHFSAGNYMRLIRILPVFEEKYLECKLLKDCRLIQLPMNCVGNFQEVHSDNYFTIQELIDILPRKRRIKLVRDIVNTRNPIPGAPPNFEGIFTLHCPSPKVEVIPAGSPGTVWDVPSDLDIDVSPRQETYSGLFTHHSFNQFVDDNYTFIPLVAQVTGWEETSAVLENHRIHPGTLLTVCEVQHDLVRLLATTDNSYYIIPVDYKGEFKILSRTFDTVHDVLSHKPENKLVVKSSDIAAESGLDSLQVGDRVKLKSSKIGIFTPTGQSGTDEEVEFVHFVKYDPTGMIQKALKVPLYLKCKFQEILPPSLKTKMTVDDSCSKSLPLEVEMLMSDPNLEIEDDPLPEKTKMTFKAVFKEDCALVSVHNINCLLPIKRTKIYLNFKNKVPRLPECHFSPLSRCPEIISKSLFKQLLKECAHVYDAIDPYSALPLFPRGLTLEEQAPSRPPKPPNLGIKSSQSVKLPQKKSVPKSPVGKLKGVFDSLLGHKDKSNSPPARPPKPKSRSMSDSSPSLPARKSTTALLKNRTSVSLPIGSPHPLSGSAAAAAVAEYDDEDYLTMPDSDKEPDEGAEDDDGYEEIDEATLNHLQSLHKTTHLPQNGNLYEFSVDQMACAFHLMHVRPQDIEQCIALKIDGKEFSKMSVDRLHQLGLTDPLVMFFHRNTKKTVKEKIKQKLGPLSRFI